MCDPFKVQGSECQNVRVELIFGYEMITISNHISFIRGDVNTECLYERKYHLKTLKLRKYQTTLREESMTFVSMFP